MNGSRRVPTIVGIVLHVLVAAPMIFAGCFKLADLVAGVFPPDVLEQIKKNGLSEEIYLIGAGELISAVLLVIPRTSSLGVLLTSGFWGGVISTHMVQGESYALGAVLLLVTWIGGYLRNPGMLASLFPRPPIR